MTEDPKPHVWMLWTLVFAVLTVAADGSWWQVLPLWLLAVSGGTWAVENRRYEERKAARAGDGYQISMNRAQADQLLQALHDRIHDAPIAQKVRDALGGRVLCPHCREAAFKDQAKLTEHLKRCAQNPSAKAVH